MNKLVHRLNDYSRNHKKYILKSGLYMFYNYINILDKYQILPVDNLPYKHTLEDSL
jgi:hypothetical protein